ncbi:hypothetical protein [Entomomonas asaccharolytica]|uniref:Uncharacterized protein n=1 Tax=Entomomonas asaccharolytica TaxID=2785331 RepID=A0A974NFV4_9GAMM|nr:hypothetical protein [Entomomonas asaccharolytica]QQP85737.1 hypothetical protein JHT90_00280 [Entomomonas asaccharolytica]
MLNREFALEILKVCTNTVIPEEQKAQIIELCQKYNFGYPSSQFISAYEYLVEKDYIKGCIGYGFSLPFIATEKGVNFLGT